MTMGDTLALAGIIVINVLAFLCVWSVEAESNKYLSALGKKKTHVATICMGVASVLFSILAVYSFAVIDH